MSPDLPMGQLHLSAETGDHATIDKQLMLMSEHPCHNDDMVTDVAPVAAACSGWAADADGCGV